MTARAVVVARFTDAELGRLVDALDASRYYERAIVEDLVKYEPDNRAERERREREIAAIDKLRAYLVSIRRSA